MFNYGHIEPFDHIFFASFAVAWIPTRHGIYFYIFSSCFNLDVEAASNGAISYTTQKFFLVILALFQCLMLVWLKELLFAIKRVVFDGANDDPREVESSKEAPKNK